MLSRYVGLHKCAPKSSHAAITRFTRAKSDGVPPTAPSPGNSTAGERRSSWRRLAYEEAAKERAKNAERDKHFVARAKRNGIPVSGIDVGERRPLYQTLGEAFVDTDAKFSTDSHVTAEEISNEEVEQLIRRKSLQRALTYMKSGLFIAVTTALCYVMMYPNRRSRSTHVYDRYGREVDGRTGVVSTRFWV